MTRGPSSQKTPFCTEIVALANEAFLSMSDYSEAAAAAVHAAITTAWFFRPRSSEYLVQSGHGWSETTVVRGRDLEGRMSNVEVENFADAEETALHISQSKTDQYNEGSLRKCFLLW